VESPGGEPVCPSFVVRAGACEGHERRIEGGGEVIQAEKLPLRGGRGVERRLHVWPYGAGKQLQVEMHPCAPARVREPAMPDGAGLDHVNGIIAEDRAYREGVRPQRIQREAKL
jgi:hypothetical protein